MADELESTLMGHVLAAGLPEEEPVMRWWRLAERAGAGGELSPQERVEVRSLRIRAGDHALMVDQLSG